MTIVKRKIILHGIWGFHCFRQAAGCQWWHTGGPRVANAVAFKKKQLEQRCTCSTLDIQDGLCASVVNWICVESYLSRHLLIWMSLLSPMLLLWDCLAEDIRLFAGVMAHLRSSWIIQGPLADVKVWSSQLGLPIGKLGRFQSLYVFVRNFAGK